MAKKIFVFKYDLDNQESNQRMVSEDGLILFSHIYNNEITTLEEAIKTLKDNSIIVKELKDLTTQELAEPFTLDGKNYAMFDKVSMIRFEAERALDMKNAFPENSLDLQFATEWFRLKGTNYYIWSNEGEKYEGDLKKKMNKKYIKSLVSSASLYILTRKNKDSSQDYLYEKLSEKDLEDIKSKI